MLNLKVKIMEFAIIQKPECTKQFGRNAFLATLEVLLRRASLPVRVIGFYEVTLARDIVESFYEEHKEKTFFTDLVDFMTSGPCVVYKLKSSSNDENLLSQFRAQIVGATNPADAELWTLRHMLGTNLTKNGVHCPRTWNEARIEMEKLRVFVQ